MQKEFSQKPDHVRHLTPVDLWGLGFAIVVALGVTVSVQGLGIAHAGAFVVVAMAFWGARARATLKHEVRPEDLLGRRVVNLGVPEVAVSYEGRVVMITGAGGSVGAELCRQVLKCRPAKILLFDHSELLLFNIERELLEAPARAHCSIVPCLGSVTDPVRVRRVLAQEGVDVVFHAAAYKHVPLVEQNPIAGAANNVMGTKVMAEAAAAAQIERFIFLSTDKAVRPTSVMGATKRMAEMVVQDAQRQHSATKFAIVRFGNVLGSSGSVLPMFQAQIDAGGPVTVTHASASRYFMTADEAAGLVLLAGAFTQGGDVFVLDMGKPQKIIDIAHRMIALSAPQFRDVPTQNRALKIAITGLRRGEKLHEECLLDGVRTHETPNPKIKRIDCDVTLSAVQIAAMLQEINVAIKTENASHLRKVIRERVVDFQAPQNHRVQKNDDVNQQRVLTQSD